MPSCLGRQPGRASRDNFWQHHDSIFSSTSLSYQCSQCTSRNAHVPAIGAVRSLSLPTTYLPICYNPRVGGSTAIEWHHAAVSWCFPGGSIYSLRSRVTCWSLSISVTTKISSTLTIIYSLLSKPPFLGSLLLAAIFLFEIRTYAAPECSFRRSSIRLTGGSPSPWILFQPSFAKVN